MSPTTHHPGPAVADYAHRVRAHLAALGADPQEPLADDLESDLEEALAEEHVLADADLDTLVRTLGPPRSYAVDYLAAAGLTVVPPMPSDPVADTWTRTVTHVRRHVAALRTRPQTRGVLGLAHDLAPLWWVVRAWTAFQLVRSFNPFRGPAVHLAPAYWFPLTAGGFLLLGALLVVSIALGRRRGVLGSRPAQAAALGWTLVALAALGPVVGVVAQESYPGGFWYQQRGWMP